MDGGPLGLVAADFDGDTFVDLATAIGPDKVWTYAGQGDGRFVFANEVVTNLGINDITGRLYATFTPGGLGADDAPQELHEIDLSTLSVTNVSTVT